MGKGAPLRWLENRLLARHIQGHGIEIGALWRKFPVPRRAHVYYVDRIASADLEQHYSEISSSLVMPDVVADAMQLPFRSASLDFIVASHVLEHLPFPLAALRHWYDVLRPGGVLLLKVPDKRHTFDAKRKRTTLQHLIEEDTDRETFDKRAHFEDWVENVDGYTRGSDGFSKQLERLLQSDYSIHYHVWTDVDIRAFAKYSRTAMGLHWQMALFWGAHFYRKETVVVLRRMK
jgi:predicted SAM-dependent methyltransferase